MLKPNFEAYEPTEYKTMPFLCLKTDADRGIVDHLVTVYGIVDLGGDMSHPGSFSKTLSERAGQIRVLDCHQRKSILNVLGVPLELKEIGRDELPPDVLAKYPGATGALWARTQFLMDTPEGKGAFIRIRDKAVSEFSYAYDTLDSDFTETDDGTKVRNLRTIRLWEYGPVLFGMNQATAVIDAKGVGDGTEDDAPVLMDEKAVDVGPTTITIRVRASGAFKEGSFRVINIGAKDNGIRARIGRLKSETTTTIQAYVFDKAKWTTERASKWVKAHGREKALSYTRTVQMVREAFNEGYNPKEGPRDYWVEEVFDEFLVVEASGSKVYYQVAYTIVEDGVTFVPRGEWVSGEYTFVARKDEDKEPETSQDELGDAKEQVLQSIEIELAQLDIMLMSGEAGPGEPPTSS